MNRTNSAFFANANGDKWFLERDGSASEPAVIQSRELCIRGDPRRP
ncbi:UNVERIFIED_ORG: hypothetical protein GGD51_000584 [Rhizobium esperanzae]|nr:hypothetical protein RPHASCH2410_PD04385 [Rhizobium phaseoli Ch24-10]